MDGELSYGGLNGSTQHGFKTGNWRVEVERCHLLAYTCYLIQVAGFHVWPHCAMLLIAGFNHASSCGRGGPWRSLDDVEVATLARVAWFDTCRLMEPLGYLPPAEYEDHYDRRVRAPVPAGALK